MQDFWSSVGRGAAVVLAFGGSCWLAWGLGGEQALQAAAITLLAAPVGLMLLAILGAATRRFW